MLDASCPVASEIKKEGMGFLNLSDWRGVGGRVAAERRATTALAQPPKYYYDHIHKCQEMVDRFFEQHGRRPKDLYELYLWELDQRQAMTDDERAIDLADWLSYFDIEPNSLLAMLSIDPDKRTRAANLLEARRQNRMKLAAVRRRAAATEAAAVGATTS